MEVAGSWHKRCKNRKCAKLCSLPLLLLLLRVCYCAVLLCSWRDLFRWAATAPPRISLFILLYIQFQSRDIIPRRNVVCGSRTLLCSGNEWRNGNGGVWRGKWKPRGRWLCFKRKSKESVCVLLFCQEYSSHPPPSLLYVIMSRARGRWRFQKTV